MRHDNGTEYQLHFQELLKKHNIASEASAPYNGLAERTVQTIKQRLGKTKADLARWDEELGPVLYSMRASQQETTLAVRP